MHSISSAVPSGELDLNLSFVFAINNMVGGTLYRTLGDFFRFQAMYGQRSYREYVLAFAINNGIRITKDRPYFFMKDKYNDWQVGGLEFKYALTNE